MTCTVLALSPWPYIIYISCLCLSIGWWWSVVHPQVLQVKWGSMWWINPLHLLFTPPQPQSLCNWGLLQVMVFCFLSTFSSSMLNSASRCHGNSCRPLLLDGLCIFNNVLIFFLYLVDESFTSFHPEAHLPLAVLRGTPVYVEVSLLDPPEHSLVLLVHSCLAYTQAPYTSWMLVYDGCVLQR